jgi:Fic family protein
MNPSLFTEKKTGTLIPIKTGTTENVAFVPDPLPPAWQFPHTLWPLLAEAKEALGRLDGIGRTLPDPQLLLRPLARREAITSSRLEGTYATAQELLLFEMNPRNPKSEADQANAWREVWNYNNALAQGTKMLKDLPFCFRMITDLHRTLLARVRGRQATPGQFRQHQVAIGSDLRYIPPPVPQMQECLDAIEKYINTEDGTYDPLVRAYLVHYQVEAIHPFPDGNGRIGRVLLSLMIYKWCNHFLPWLYMSEFFERFKDEYISKLFAISAEGAWERWVEFCLRGTIRQANDSIRKCDRLRALKDDMHQKARPGSARTDHIIDRLFSRPFVSVASLARRNKVTYPTAKTDIEHLEKVGILVKLEKIRPATYYSPEIFNIAYAESDSLV